MPEGLLGECDLLSQNGHFSKLSGMSVYLFQFETRQSIAEANTAFRPVSQTAKMLLTGSCYLLQTFPEQ